MSWPLTGSPSRWRTGYSGALASPSTGGSRTRSPTPSSPGRTAPTPCSTPTGRTRSSATATSPTKPNPLARGCAGERRGGSARPAAGPASSVRTAGTGTVMPARQCTTIWSSGPSPQPAQRVVADRHHRALDSRGQALPARDQGRLGIVSPLAEQVSRIIPRRRCVRMTHRSPRTLSARPDATMRLTLDPILSAPLSPGFRTRGRSD